MVVSREPQIVSPSAMRLARWETGDRRSEPSSALINPLNILMGRGACANSDSRGSIQPSMIGKGEREIEGGMCAGSLGRMRRLLLTYAEETLTAAQTVWAGEAENSALP